jgi:hypothetical protein
VLQMHCRFGLLHFLEQRIAVSARWKFCGLRSHLFGPRDNPILKGELMFGNGDAALHNLVAYGSYTVGLAVPNSNMPMAAGWFPE